MKYYENFNNHYGGLSSGRLRPARLVRFYKKN